MRVIQHWAENRRVFWCLRKTISRGSTSVSSRSAKDSQPRKYISFLTVCERRSAEEVHQFPHGLRESVSSRAILGARQDLTRFWKKPNRFSMRPARASVTVKKRNGDVRVYREGVGENEGCCEPVWRGGKVLSW